MNTDENPAYATVESAKYVGDELSVFCHANNWKAYFGSYLEPFIGRTVLEVGAGIGATTAVLYRDSDKHWTCLEPDPSLANQIVQKIKSGGLPRQCSVRAGSLESLDRELFDTILYIDVLEHIKEDQTELEQANQHLEAGGVLAILAPAYQILFSPFDSAIGHHRRYSASTLSDLLPSGFDCEFLRYLDSAGLLLSLANRFLLRRSSPTVSNIRLWDSLVIPVSRVVDPLFGYRFGRSVVGVWRKHKKNGEN